LTIGANAPPMMGRVHARIEQRRFGEGSTKVTLVGKALMLARDAPAEGKVLQIRW
jgi:hypothetical protein